MERSFTSSPSVNTGIDSSEANMGSSENYSPFSSTYGPMQPPCHSHQVPNTYPLHPFLVESPPMSCIFWPNKPSSVDQSIRAVDAMQTKLARNKRKMVRQIGLRQDSSSAPIEAPGGNSVSLMDMRTTLASDGDASKIIKMKLSRLKQDIYDFFPSNNKRLKVLLRKELKYSDVGSNGRIVLPKREAEQNLPTLADKEGIQIVIRNVYTNEAWNVKFKYWSNNKSRMYVLENTGEFAKENCLQIGDSLNLYEDESKTLYFSINKEESRAVQCSKKGSHNNYLYMPCKYQAVEQLDKYQQYEASSLAALDVASMFRHMEEPVTGFNIQHDQTAVADDCFIDECYRGLGMLPGMNYYNFSL